MVELSSVCYVDDLNFVTKDPALLVIVLGIVCEFARDLQMHISSVKTVLWGSDVRVAREIACNWGLTAADSFVTLGVEWSTNHMASPLYKKEEARLEEAKLRLARLQHLPTTVEVKAHVINVGILTLIDYLPAPSVVKYASIKSAIKKVFSCLHGSPEVVLNVLLESSLDPDVRWEMSLVKLLCDTYKIQGGRQLIEDVSVMRRHSRLAAILRIVKKRGWELTEGILLTPLRLNLRLPWESIRKRVMQALKMHHLQKLAERRPRVYEGIDMVQPKQHRKNCCET